MFKDGTRAMKIKTMANGEINDTVLGPAVIEDSTVMIHKSGKPFIRYLYKDYIKENLIKDFKKNIAAEYDNVVVIEGGEGSGKSNLAWYIAKLYDPNVDMRQCYVYDFDDLKNKILKLNGNDKGKVFWLDESSNMANNRSWMTQNSQYLIQLLEMMRSRGWTLILCIPSMDRLDIYIREYRYRYHLSCAPAQFDNDLKKQDRGYCEIQKKVDGKEKAGGYARYPKMTEADEKLYKQIKNESQVKKFDEAFEEKGKGAKYKKMYEEERKKQRSIMYALDRSGTMPKDAIMQLFGYTDKEQYYNAIGKAKKELGE